MGSAFRPFLCRRPATLIALLFLTRINTVPAYYIQYAARVAGRRMFGRDVFVLPQQGARDGVTIVMLTVPSPAVPSSSMVGQTGILHQPLSSFYFGA